MPRAVHAVVFAVALVAAWGCSDGNEPPPNTSLKVPDIKPGRGASGAVSSGKTPPPRR